MYRGKQYNLPEFRKAMKELGIVLPDTTYWRYVNGILPPPLGPLLIDNPELAEALARDARALAEQGRD